ncbi:MAG: hypothetical protein KatS3mg108_2719 [Isosphaeraceae bacterium]|nr:MAG: hypothetical protein KatS3mg108_2719 [Isosphaeraceae bacterium]
MNLTEQNRRAAESHRAGVTVIEVVVVVAIIGLLAALLVPALQAARESARRMKCINKLKQFGIAILNYESAHRVLPLGRMPTSHFSLHAAILPYLDQRPLYDALNLGVGATDTSRPGVNATVIYARLGVFLCPSDPLLKPPNSNYAGCLGDGRPSMRHRGAPIIGLNGAFVESPISVAEIKGRPFNHGGDV